MNKKKKRLFFFCVCRCQQAHLFLENTLMRYDNMNDPRCGKKRNTCVGFVIET